MILSRSQNTLRKDVSFSGIGIHSGVDVSLRFVPQKANTGIFFQRVDLPEKPIIPAHLDYVVDTSRSTTIGKDGVVIHTVEHVLSACKAYQVDNLLIEISNKEPPVGNGSADVFVAMIEEAGVASQKAEVSPFVLQEPMYYSDGDVHLVALPYSGWKVSYTLHYPHSPPLLAQYFSSDMSQDVFRNEIAPCRTFSMYEEVRFLMDQGLIKGGSLDNAVVIKGDAVLSKGGLRFPDEMARHKVLDLMGDFALMQMDLAAHIIAIRSGHGTNIAFAKMLYETSQRGAYV